jgi:hypothetical protein
MLTSKEALMSEARIKGYKPEILEKVYCLLSVLQQIMEVPYLKERLVLKGGTALNLFCVDEMPRLSVDIDLNYIGHIDREVMLAERRIITEAIQQLFEQNQFERYRSPTHHAGGKMVWFYASVLGQRGALEVDINFMHRQVLWPINWKKSNLVQQVQQSLIPVLDIHELAAGKLAALLDRKVSRDLFDAHYLMHHINFDLQKLRLSFVVYLAMTEIPMERLTTDQIQYDLTDLRNRLLPVLHQQAVSRSVPGLKAWAEKLTHELKESLSALLPLKKNEIEFIEVIRNHGEIKADLLTNDSELAQKIQGHPALLWAAKKIGMK